MTNNATVTVKAGKRAEITIHRARAEKSAVTIEYRRGNEWLNDGPAFQAPQDPANHPYTPVHPEEFAARKQDFQLRISGLWTGTNHDPDIGMSRADVNTTAERSAISFFTGPGDKDANTGVVVNFK
jgi:hypothetical protein